MRIFCLGDSTMQYNDAKTWPQTGWAQMLPLFLHEGVQVCNYAKNGRSTKSFLGEQRFEEVLKKLGEGDYVFIQFGHNDEKADVERHTDPFGSYQENLKYMIKAIIKKNAFPVLFTSIVRRFGPDHGMYPQAMIEVAQELQIPFVDMNALTKPFMSAGISITGPDADESSADSYLNLAQKVAMKREEETGRYYMSFAPGLYDNYPSGKDDNTHLRPEGAFLVASLAIHELKKILEPKSVKKGLLARVTTNSEANQMVFPYKGMYQALLDAIQ